MTNQQKPCWWEKTVEYAFVRGILKEDAVAFPMAGKPEKWLGDLIEKMKANFGSLSSSAMKLALAARTKNMAKAALII